MFEAFGRESEFPPIHRYPVASVPGRFQECAENWLETFGPTCSWSIIDHKFFPSNSSSPPQLKAFRGNSPLVAMWMIKAFFFCLKEPHWQRKNMPIPASYDVDDFFQHAWELSQEYFMKEHERKQTQVLHCQFLQPQPVTVRKQRNNTSYH